jgi:prefoldin subunit 5
MEQLSQSEIESITQCLKVIGKVCNSLFRSIITLTSLSSIVRMLVCMYASMYVKGGCYD